jgi:hypothetical protein
MLNYILTKLGVKTASDLLFTRFKESLEMRLASHEIKCTWESPGMTVYQIDDLRVCTPGVIYSININGVSMPLSIELEELCFKYVQTLFLAQETAKEALRIEDRAAKWGLTVMPGDINKEGK